MAGKVLKATTGLGLDKQSHEAQLRDGKPHPHPEMEDMVNTVGFSLVQELMQYMKGPEGEEALECILDRQSRVVSRLATTTEARQATRVAAAECVTGSYDAVQRQLAAVFNGKSGMMQLVAVGVVAYVSLLAVGVLLTCWRFAFFGLH